VGNISAPAVHLAAFTLQIAPTSLSIINRTANQITLAAEPQNNFPNLDALQSGLQFDTVPPGATAPWIQVNSATFSFLTYNSSYSFTAKARNLAGSSPSSAVRVIQVDSRPPAAPVITGLISPFTLIGTAEAGTTVELFENGDSHKPNAAAVASVVAKARDKGLILLSCGTYGNVIRILVPLTAPDALLDEGLQILADSFAAVR